MSGFGFWGGPQGVPIPTYHTEGQQERPYFHGGPGWSHEGHATSCHLPHPGDLGFEDPEVYEDLLQQGDPGPYPEWEAVELENGERAVARVHKPRHRKPWREVRDAQHAPKVAPRSELKWVGVDLDGTIAVPLWTPEDPTSEIGAPIWRNVGKLVELEDHGYKIVIHTSRPWTDYEAIESWLNFHNLPWHQIQCGKPLFALYCDDRGRHESAESWLP